MQARAGAQVSEAEYLRIALADPDGKWELVKGALRQKPGMTARHNRYAWLLGVALTNQLDVEQFDVRVDAGRVRRSAQNYFIPDVVVFPAAYADRIDSDENILENYDEPMLLVIEVWSCSTGAFDVQTKLPVYQRRQDREIWAIHPYEHWLRAWRLQPDGSYAEATVRSGHVRPVVLPDVIIDLDKLFRRRVPQPDA